MLACICTRHTESTSVVHPIFVCFTFRLLMIHAIPVFSQSVSWPLISMHNPTYISVCRSGCSFFCHSPKTWWFRPRQKYCKTRPTGQQLRASFYSNTHLHANILLSYLLSFLPSFLPHFLHSFFLPLFLSFFFPSLPASLPSFYPTKAIRYVCMGLQYWLVLGWSDTQYPVFSY